MKNYKPNSKKNFFEYDIALITLSEPFNRTYKQTLVRPICLPKPKVIPSDINKLSLEEDITIIGMGVIGKKGTDSSEGIRSISNINRVFEGGGLADGG